jgi:hypothetical protein
MTVAPNRGDRVMPYHRLHLFLILRAVSLLVVAQSVAFETLARTATWKAIAGAVTAFPSPLLAGFGILVAAAVLTAAWTRVPQCRRRVAAA